MRCQKLAAGWWIQPGWSRTSPSVLPTQTAPRPSKRPPWLPSGLSKASEAAKGRWVQSAWQLPVWNFEAGVLLWQGNTWRLPVAGEVERLLLFDSNYTMGPDADKLSEARSDTTRRQQLGNSFAVGPVAWLLWGWLSRLGLCPAP